MSRALPISQGSTLFWGVPAVSVESGVEATVCLNTFNLGETEQLTGEEVFDTCANVLYRIYDVLWRVSNSIDNVLASCVQSVDDCATNIVDELAGVFAKDCTCCITDAAQNDLFAIDHRALVAPDSIKCGRTDLINAFQSEFKTLFSVLLEGGLDLLRLEGTLCPVEGLAETVSDVLSGTPAGHVERSRGGSALGDALNSAANIKGGVLDIIGRGVLGTDCLLQWLCGILQLLLESFEVELALRVGFSASIGQGLKLVEEADFKGDLGELEGLGQGLSVVKAHSGGDTDGSSGEESDSHDDFVKSFIDY